MSDSDRVGLAWRDELAAQIMLHLDSIDHLEIIAEREWSGSRRRLDALRDLARQVPVSLHGVSLGLVSSGDVSEERLGRLARLVERVEILVPRGHAGRRGAGRSRQRRGEGK